MKASTFIIQVLFSLGFILSMLAYTAVVSQAFVSPQTVLKVIQKGGAK